MAHCPAQSVPSRPSLPIELHAATRSEHSSLNKLILTRLPLCLPPHSFDPSAYALGMTVFSNIYTEFEKAWDNLLSKDEHSIHKLEPRHRQLLLQLRTRNIARTSRIEKDLHNLRHRLDCATSQQLSALQSHTTHFSRHITDSISVKPHVTLAYAWTMYLALFNGGRYIVKQLLQPGQDFWQPETHHNPHSHSDLLTPTTSEIPPVTPNQITTTTAAQSIRNSYLSFWFFDDENQTHDLDANHGESIKLEFKRNFDLAAELLTDSERDDVVRESKRLFVMCAEMVEFLDGVVSKRRQEEGEERLQQQGQELSRTYEMVPEGVSPKDTVSTKMEFGRVSAPFAPIASIWQVVSSVMLSVSGVLAPRMLRSGLESQE